MAFLTVITDKKEIKLEFHGTPLLRDVLAQNGIAVFSPCGGNGRCGKCKVTVSGAVSAPDVKEIAENCRLACRTVLLGDVVCELLGQEEIFDHIETESKGKRFKKADWEKYGAAVDIGTTTVALKLFNASGECIGEAFGANPQRAVAADVIGRIGAALQGKGELLQRQISDFVSELLKTACGMAGITPNEVEKLVITGNTAMMYLFTGKSPESISVAPFESQHLFGEWTDEKTYIAPCMNAFAGGDVVCAVMASGMCDGGEISLLCDIGTNGEMALWKNSRLYVTSAAAGPAFEGGEISCGCGNINGAVDRVSVENGGLVARTIGGEGAKGICGSGLADAVAAFLELGYIDKTGYATERLELTANGGSIELTQDDIRAVQLAKGAIRAGIETLLQISGTAIEEIENFFISGGFGNHLSLESAAKIGLVPQPLAKIAKTIGNGALAGAADMLFDFEKIETAKKIALSAEHIMLGGSEDFYEKFIAAIDF